MASQQPTRDRTILRGGIRRLTSIFRSANSQLRRLWILTRCPGAVIGKRVSIGPRVVFRMTDGAGIAIGSDSHVGRDTVIAAKRGCIEIDSKCFIGHDCTIVANSAIQIGADCLIGEYVTIRDQNHGIEYSEIPFSKQEMRSAPISIGNNVWIGAKATIVAGVTIGPNSVVAANAVVTKDVPSWTVVGGVPAKVLRNIALAFDNSQPK